MQILAYHCPEAAEKDRWLAIVSNEGKRQVVVFYRPTREAAIEAAQADWDKHLAAAAAHAAALVKARAERKAAKEQEVL